MTPLEPSTLAYTTKPPPYDVDEDTRAWVVMPAPGVQSRTTAPIRIQVCLGDGDGPWTVKSNGPWGDVDHGSSVSREGAVDVAARVAALFHLSNFDVVLLAAPTWVASA